MTAKSNAISLKDIASACNVSLMTVSRALREDSVVNPETRARILKKAAELNYLRDHRKGRPVGAGRKINAPPQIQLIFGNANGNMYYFHMRLLTAIEQQLAQAGFECIIRTCNGEFDTFIRLQERVRHDECMGTVILGSFREEQLENLLSAIPGAVVLDNYVRPTLEAQYSSFAFNNREAAYLATWHLLQQNRQRILLLCGSEGHFFSNDMIDGYRNALRDAQRDFDHELVHYADFTASGAGEVLRQVIKDGLQFDAVFTNDEMAAGVFRVLLEHNMKIPEDIAVCGCDNLPVGEQLYPELTTIMLNYQHLAGCVVQHIISPQFKVVFPAVKLTPRLLVKASSVRES